MRFQIFYFPLRVYEALVHVFKEDEKCLVVLLSSAMVMECMLQENQKIAVDAQLRVNRVPFCEMHEVIDRLESGHLDLLFPQTYQLPLKKPVSSFL